MSKRTYTKKSPYWNKFTSGSLSQEDKKETDMNVEPVMAGDNYYVSNASVYSRGSTGTTSRRRNSIYMKDNHSY